MEINIDNQTFEVPKEAVSIEGHSIVDDKALSKFKDSLIESQLVRYGTQKKFSSDLTRSLIGTRPVIFMLYGNRFKADNEGSVFMVNDSGEPLKDDKGRISVSRYFDSNPQLVSKLKKGLHALEQT
jgi:hypothetical protein